MGLKEVGVSIEDLVALRRLEARLFMPVKEHDRQQMSHNHRSLNCKLDQRKGNYRQLMEAKAQNQLKALREEELGCELLHQQYKQREECY